MKARRMLAHLAHRRLQDRGIAAKESDTLLERMSVGELVQLRAILASAEDPGSVLGSAAEARVQELEDAAAERPLGWSASPEGVAAQRLEDQRYRMLVVAALGQQRVTGEVPAYQALRAAAAGAAHGP